MSVLDKQTVLFAGSERYAEPLPETQRKKLKGLGRCFDPFIIAFHNGAGFQSKRIEGATLLLLPSKLPRPFRYSIHFTVTFFLTLHGALTRKYRSVVAQSPYEALAPALALLPWKLFALSKKPKLIIEVHADWKEGVMLYHRTFFSRAEKILRHGVARVSFSQADAFRAISGYCRNMIPAGGKPVFVFPTFTDIESFVSAPDIQSVENREGYPRPYFIYAGMLIYLKGITHLINAFSRISEKYPDAGLVIAGKGDEETHLRNQVEKLALSSRVHFAGHVHQDRLAMLIKESAALVLPSLTEGLGRVAIEALVLERPVVASGVGGLPEIIEDGKTGMLVAPGDEEGLSRALSWILEHPESAGSMGKAGRQYVLKRFDYDQYFNAYKKMVKETCDSGVMVP